MLRKTIIVLATAAALTGALTADAVALATAHTGWDGLGGGAHIARKHFGGHGGAFSSSRKRPPSALFGWTSRTIYPPRRGPKTSSPL
jgi:hypothetical protein